MMIFFRTKTHVQFQSQFGQTMAAMFTFVQTQASNLGLSGHFTGS